MARPKGASRAVFAGAYEAPVIALSCDSPDINLDWTWLSDDPTSFQVWLSYQSANYTLKTTLAGDVRTYVVDGYECPGVGTLNCKVRALYGTTPGPYSNISSITANEV